MSQQHRAERVDIRAVLLLVAVLVGVLTVPLLGGRLSALGHIKLRLVPAIFGALAIQLVITAVLPGGSEWLHRILHVGTYVLAAAFIWANRKITGVWVVAGGAALNVIAILANGGVMPASASAERTAGVTQTPGGFAHPTALPPPPPPFLRDILAVPKGWPLSNVYSVGDVVIAIGVVVVIHSLCGSRSPLRRRDRAGQVATPTQ